MKEKKRAMDDGLTRRRFLKGSGGALVGASWLSVFGLPATPVAARATESAGAKVYVCPPCGQPCDKLTFDKPGTCPTCGMTLIPVGGGAGAPPQVAILIFNGAEIIDFAGPWEVFGTVGFQVHTVAEKLEPLTMVFGQKLMPDYTFENSPKADILLVPGGGVFQYMEDDKLMRWLQAKASDVNYVMSVCTGAFLLARAGLLAGQTVTATYGMIEDLLTPQTKVVYDRRYVDNGKIITAAGLSSGIDGALHLVAKILGRGSAQAAALEMEYHWDAEAQWARAALADKYLPDGLAYAKPKLRGAEAKLISTEGDTDRWETKLLVSTPGSTAEIIALLRTRIAANTASSGMFKPISHMRGAPTLSPAGANDSEVRWKFTDDLGRDWSGLGLIEPAPEEKGQFIVTLKLARIHKSAAR
jgi:putative intracellular protease/amidase